MELQNLNEHQLSKKVGISAATITHWKQRRNRPSLQICKRIADALQVSEHWLKGESGAVMSEDSHDYRIPEIHWTDSLRDQVESLAKSLGWARSELVGEIVRRYHITAFEAIQAERAKIKSLTGDKTESPASPTPWETEHLRKKAKDRSLSENSK